MQQIKVWSVNRSDEEKEVVSCLEEVNNAEAEYLLEDLLVREPEMLMPNLQLVGRQTPTGDGPLDLLGVDENGQLVVFELKRGTLRREAVAQIIDYGAQLNQMSTEELADHIAERSGGEGIAEIDNFREWYDEAFPSDENDFAGKPRLALVGLGADEATKAMVFFLADSDLDMTLITFYGFERDGEFLLARQVEVEGRSESDRTWLRKAEKQQIVEENAKKLGFWDLLQDIEEVVMESSDRTFYLYPTQKKYGFYLPEMTDRGNLSHRIYAGARLDPDTESVQLKFGKRAFKVADEAMEEFIAATGAERTDEESRLRLSSMEDWESVRDDAQKIFSAIYEGWKEWREAEENRKREEAEES